MCLNHPETIPFPHLALKKLFPMKLVPGAKNVGDCWYKTFLTLRFFQLCLGHSDSSLTSH